MKDFYLPSLDGIRACAFLLVFVAHAGLDQIVPGGLGVTVFFFLSGYLITTLLRREVALTGTVSIREFYVRRCFRILPPMYVTLGLACAWAMMVPSTRQPTPIGIVSAVAYFYNYAELITNNIARLPAGMGVLWSLMIEEHFYFLFPFVYLALLRSRLTRYQQGALLGVVCILVLLWRGCLVFALHTPLVTLPRWTYSSTDARFDSILWGCILAIVYNPIFKDGPAILLRQKGKLAWAGGLLLTGTLLVRNPVFRETFRYTIQSIALMPIFYYAVAEPLAFINHVLTWSVLRWLGWLSYSMYLAHLFFLSTIQSQLHQSRVVSAAAAFVLATLYALIIRYLVERPSRALQKVLTRRAQAKKILVAAEVLATADLNARSSSAMTA